jgi:hypothetical protein
MRCILPVLCVLVCVCARARACVCVCGVSLNQDCNTEELLFYVLENFCWADTVNVNCPLLDISSSFSCDFALGGSRNMLMMSNDYM